MSSLLAMLSSRLLCNMQEEATSRQPDPPARSRDISLRVEATDKI